jgi:hypothetical protein
LNATRNIATVKYRESQEGKGLEGVLIVIDDIAIRFLEIHGIICCSKIFGRLFEFQCRFNEEHLIAAYHKKSYVHPRMEQATREFCCFCGGL